MMVMMVSTAAGAMCFFVALAEMAIFFRRFCLQRDMVNAENSQNLPHIFLCSAGICGDDVHRSLNGIFVDAPYVDVMNILHTVDVHNRLLDFINRKTAGNFL